MSWSQVGVLCAVAFFCSIMIGGRYTVDVSGSNAFVTDRLTGSTVFCTGYVCRKARREPTPD